MKRIIILASGIILTGNGKGIKQMMAEDRVKFDRHVLTQGEHEQFKSFSDLSPEAQEVLNAHNLQSSLFFTDTFCRIFFDTFFK